MLHLSPILAGCWRMAEWDMNAAKRLSWIEASIDLGVTSFDHADIYGEYQVEPLFGQALALKPSLRDQMQLVSKCGIQLQSAHRPAHRLKAYDTSTEHIENSVNTSLQALGTDYLDLLLIHRPDALLNADEVAACFEKLRAAGKVRHFGVSNFTVQQFSLLHSRIPLATNQLECSPLHLDALHDGSFDQAQELRCRPMIWSPMAGGRIFTEQSERADRVRRVLGEIALRHHTNISTLIYAWLLALPCKPYPIVGSQRLEALQEAVAAQQIQLDRATWYEVWTAGAGQEVA